MNNILKLASIRKYVDENMPEGMYFDVFENIKLPSEDGDYSKYDAVITVYSKEHKDKIKALFKDVNAYVYIAFF
jgi:hypothetical protein